MQTVRLQYATVQNVVDYTVVVSVPNPDGALLPGMTATVNFETAKVSNVLRIPNAALRFRPSEAMLGAADIPRRPAGQAGDTTGGRRQFTAADSARFRQMMAQRAQGGGGGGGFGGGGFGGQRPGGMLGGGLGGGQSQFAVLWTVDSAGKPAPVRVHTGLTDGQETEITGPNVKEGMKIIAAVTNEHGGSGSSSPFQQQQQNGFRNRVL